MAGIWVNFEKLGQIKISKEKRDMNKFGVKKWLAFALVLVSAIACFAALGVSPEQVKAFFSKEVSRDADYIDIGLEYKDGWYLIKDSEDYYAMRDAVNSGVGQSLKYRLENDIEVDSRAGMNVFSGTLNGNGYSLITVDNEPEYEEDVKAGAINLGNGNNVTLGAITLSLGAHYLTLVGHGILGTNVQSSSLIVDSVINNVSDGGEYEINFASSSLAPGLQYGHCLGAIGLLKDATLENFNVQYNGDISIDADAGIGFDSYYAFVGGLCGFAYNSTIRNCIVRFGNSKIINTGSTSLNQNVWMGAIAGIMQKSNITNCLVVSNYTNGPIVASKGNIAEFANIYVGSDSVSSTVSNCHFITTQYADANDLGWDASFWNSLSGFSGGKVATSWEQFHSSTCQWVCIKDAPIKNATSTTSRIIQKCFIQAPSITITAHPNEGKWSDGTTTAKTFTVGSGNNLLSAISTPTRDTYQFSGWYTAASGGSIVNKVTSSQTVYAHWTQTAYYAWAFTYPEEEGGLQIRSNPGNGWSYEDVDSAEIDPIYYGSVIAAAPATTCASGYTVRWFYEDMVTLATFPLTVTGDIILHGIAYAEYTIRYQEPPVGGAIATVKYCQTDEITLRADVSLNAGYYSTGLKWEVVSNTGNWEGAYDLGRLMSGMHGNVTLQLIGNLIEYNINYNWGGGTQPSNYSSYPKTYTREQSVTLPGGSGSAVAGPTREGYTFAGWTTDNWSTPNLNVIIYTGSTGHKSYTANWTVVPCTITLVLNNGTISGDNPINYDVTTPTFNLGTPTREGYEFAGWTGENLTEATITVTITQGTTGNKTYTATWTLIEYTITYVWNGGVLGEGVTNPEKYTIESESFTLNNPTKAGYDFAGWTGSNGSTAQTTITITTGTYGNKEYTANWTPGTAIYTVYHYFEKVGIAEPNEATADHWAVETEELEGTTESTVTISRKNYTGFTSKSASDSTLTIIGDGSATHSYYYTRNTYILTANANSGSIASTTGWSGTGNTATRTFDYQESYSFPNVSKDGNTFDGWHTAENGGEQVTTSTAMGASAATIYAHWIAHELTINYHLNGGTDVSSDSTFSGGDPCLVEKYLYGGHVDTQWGLTNATSSRVTRTGYTVDERYWNTATDGSGTNVDADNTTYTIGGGGANDLLIVVNISLEDGDATLELYMIWTPNIYKATLDNQNATTAGTVAYWYEYNTCDPYYYYSDDTCTTQLGSDGYHITLPTKSGYEFVGYYTDINAGGTQYVNASGECVNNLYNTVADDIILYAYWELITYSITFIPNEGEIRDYAPTDKYGKGGFSGYENGSNIIEEYTIENVFDLPNRSQVFWLGYTAMHWKVVSVEGVREQDQGNTWDEEIVQGANDNQDSYEVSQKIGNVTLKAIWIENKFNIKLNANDGTNIKIIENVGYTSVVTLLGYDGKINVSAGEHVSSGKDYLTVASAQQDVGLGWQIADSNTQRFVGWAVELPGGENSVNGAPTYMYIYTNEREGESYIYQIIGEGIEGSLEANLTANWGTKIIKDGATIQRIVLGDWNSTQTVEIYAIWTPVYSITINANIPENVLKSTTDAGIFTAGTRLESDGNPITQISIDNHYFKEYLLYTQDSTDVFITPSGTERLFYYGYYIEDWIIKVDDSKYYKYSEIIEQDYSPEDWILATIDDRVESGVNMQYLQGNITATPQWKALTFDVRFQTKSNEAYKIAYLQEADKITTVTFNNNYVISEHDSVENGVKATDIFGYLPIYAHAHKQVNKQGVIDDTYKIAKKAIWNHRLDYQQYSAHPIYSSSDRSEDVDWFIVVEGYYSPDLYRMELNLQLPYTINNDFAINENNYTLEEIATSELQVRYEAMIISGDGYVDSDNYLNRQGKLYKDGDKYYIYLLQDQIVQGETVYARYNDGKTIENATEREGKKLPTFEIAYYQMQYYYTINGSAEVNMYPMCSVDEEEYGLGAKKKLGVENKADTEIKKPDWKYVYCDVDYNDAPQDYKLNVYWYRNVINLDIFNLLDTKDSLNGYTLITETEQVTEDGGELKLKEHNKYHLVIFTANDYNVYEYVIYSFDSLSLLGENENYKYSSIINLFNTKTVQELTTMGIFKSSKGLIPIYFGNKVKVEAVDQKVDQSLDEYIGYRFNEYKYQIKNKKDNTATCTSLSEFDEYINDASKSYAIEVDLQNYEHGKNNNTTNYFSDKDKVSIVTCFEKIQYVFNYKVTNSEYVEMPYGSIRINYTDFQDQNNQISYAVTVNSENVLRSRMQVRLGSELLYWDLRNMGTNLTSTYIYTFEASNNPTIQIEGQILQFIVDASFLRTYLYDLEINNAPYETSAEQVFGDINAVCKDIEFDIRVDIKDLSTGTTIRTYTLADADLTNAIFTINGVTKVSIDNAYILDMLTKQDGDEYVYYYQDEVKYVLRNLYIMPSLSKSNKLLETTFDYPAGSFGSISMNVNHQLLDGSVNYTQFIQVDLSNRVITFCAEVAPTYILTLNIVTNEYDILKDKRQVLIENTLIASAEEIKDENGNKDMVASQLKFTNNNDSMEYLGYWGQQTLFVFNANKTYYKSLKLTDADVEMHIGVNGNLRYSVTQTTTIIIELIPQTYSVDAYVVYQDVEYNTTDEDKNGRKSLAKLTNASGIAIFAENGILISVDKNNAGATTGVFYPGDKIYVAHTLNSAVAKDFNVSLYNNGVGPDNYVVGKGFEIMFGGQNIVLKIAVTPKIEAVTITSNMPEYEFGEIYVQVNTQEAVKVNGEAVLELINGDQLTIYVKEAIAYEFTDKYTYSENGTKNNVITSEASGDYVGYKQFVLFEQTGFSTSQNGVYILIFKQLQIDIEFKYYEIIPQVQEVQAGSGYVAESDTAIIQKGSLITLINGIDTEGYRFVNYSYGAPMGEGRKELELSELEDGKQQFTVDNTILEYIDQQAKISNQESTEETTLKLVIYINFIKQYKYEVNYELEHENAEKNVVCEIVDAEAYPLIEGEYYDYGTEFKIIAQTEDTEHYRIEAIITNSEGSENITSTNRPDYLADIKETNKLNLAGFTVSKVFTSDYIIQLKAIAETYDTMLKLQMNKGNAVDEVQVILPGQTEDMFKLTNTVYYTVDATHAYGSEVRVKIYVLNTPEVFDGEQYYVLKGATVNGNEFKIVGGTTGTVEGKACTVYHVQYNLTGADLPMEQQLLINLNAMYYVKVN